MSDKPSDVMWSQAQVHDLERRIGVLERVVTGRTREPIHHRILSSLYFDALNEPALDEPSSRHWDRQLSALDSRQLLVLSRILRDPFPWRPFVVLLDLYVQAGFDLTGCRDLVLDAAQDHLRLQGLGRVEPRDVLGTPLPSLRKFRAIRL